MNQRVAVGAVYVAATFMSIMDTTIVNVAVPTLGRHFRVSVDAVDAVAISYLVALAVAIPASGWLGDRVGGRRLLLVAVTAFTVTSGLCGLAGSLDELVGLRILQGLSGGVMTPVAMAMLYREFPPEERVRAAGILTVPTALAPAMGPVLGGVLVADLSWRWVFFVNVPVGVVAVVFALVWLADEPGVATAAFDLVGLLLSAAGFGALMYGVSEGPSSGWASPAVDAALAGGTVVLVATVLVEVRRTHPLLDLRLFADRAFRTACSVSFLAGVAFLGTLYVLALFYQDGLGLSALGSGLATFPEALGVMCSVQVATRRLYATLGPHRLMTAGLALVAVALGSMTQVDGAGGLWWMRGFVFAAGAGMGLVFMPTQNLAFTTVDREAVGAASTLFNAGRQLSSAVGVGVLTTVIAAVGPTGAAHAHAPLRPYHAAFAAAAALAATGAALAWWSGERATPGPEPAATPTPAAPPFRPGRR